MTEALSLCAQEVRKNDHDQFLCGLFSPADKQEAFFAMQVFHMETARIRDVVNEAHMGLIRLQWWRDLVGDIYADKAPNVEHGMHKEIIQALKDKGVEQDLFERYFNARTFDMEDQAHDDLPALLRYLEATGGVAAQIKEGAIGLEISDAAKLIGAASSLCQMIKTMAFQARSGRCKIPRSLAQSHNLDLKSFFELKCDEGLKACTRELVGEIKKMIATARETKSSTNAVLLNTVAIEDYLARLEKVDFDPFNPNLGSGRLVKQLKLGFKAWRNKY
ncbi:putative phytoene synthase (Terpenoid synthase) [Candidatus Terasakiella magnetica]|uniref:Putative phytoene synthase (Terpenoid synthase) n=1 Tax=Candidatus Terasakiella magnetica TaxID=1867952 RepID=A0A1C3RCH4_9PROT|nr:squalene/phytoene synthase family protein [Candidatus Terasakiella magnetica]SCA54948.1 putative phytoene synthase (Terpenoid synthase) [Candidatus Terasakiella magnetica]